MELNFVGWWEFVLGVALLFFGSISLIALWFVAQIAWMAWEAWRER